MTTPAPPKEVRYSSRTVRLPKELIEELEQRKLYPRDTLGDVLKRLLAHILPPEQSP